jgi:hypothetical protein
MIVVPGTTLQLRASLMEKRATRDTSAWLGSYMTVRLDEQLRALRVHAGGGIGAATAANIHLATGASLKGAWFAIGDFIQPYDEYITTRALPQTATRFGPRSMFTDAALATFFAGTILNVGLAGPLFGHRGGGEQAEFVEGEAPRLEQLRGLWGREYGHS